MKYLGLILVLAACGGSSESSPDGGIVPTPDGSLTYNPCPKATHVGGFSVALQDGYTSAQGQVASGVVPGDIPEATQTAGECILYRPRSLLCNPACANGQTCGENGVCITYPSNLSVGTVAITGLTAPVQMTANAPVYYYTFRGTLPHPGFMPGDTVSLSATGAEVFALRGRGIDPLTLTATVVPLRRGQPAQAGWNPPSVDVPAKITLSLNIANHGGNPGQIDCIVPDTGSYAIPSSLVDALLDLGASGFPTLIVTRKTVDAATLSQGCIEFSVQHQAVADIDILGLISCSGDQDCPQGQTCQVDLTCQ